MKRDQEVKPNLEPPSTVLLVLEIEELEPIEAPLRIIMNSNETLVTDAELE
jgi:hypothetical protein